VVLGWQLDLMILEVFSNLNDFMINWSALSSLAKDIKMRAGVCSDCALRPGFLIKFLLSSVLLMFVVLKDLVASVTFKVVDFLEHKDSLPMEEEFAYLFKL